VGIMQITVVAVISAVLALLLRANSPPFALIITIAASALILLAVLPSLSGLLALLTRMAEAIDGAGHFVTVIKVIGIAYMAEFGSQICIDAGETAIASKLELAGKLLIMAVATPLVLSLTEQVIGLMP